MGIAYDYLTRRHGAAYADAIELERVLSEIKTMEDRLENLTESLAGARVYASVLTTSIATSQQLVEDECKRNDWPLPEPPAEPPAPAPIGDGITRETTSTLAFEAVRVANPFDIDADTVVCVHEGCGQALVCTDAGVWVHIRSGRAVCKPEPAATTRTDDPLRFQRLDQGEVREAVTCICGTPGIGQYEGPQRDCPVHGERRDGGESRG